MLVGCNNSEGDEFVNNFSKEDIPKNSSHLPIIDDPLIDLSAEEFEKAYAKLPDDYHIKINNWGELAGMFEELENETITKKEAERVASFGSYWGPQEPLAISLKGLRFFRNIDSISLEYSSIKDISELGNLKKLNKIDINSSDIIMNNSTEELRSLIDIQGRYDNGTYYISLADCNIADVDFLNGISDLSDLSLWLDKNDISSVEPLSHLQEVNEFSLSGNNIEDISPLSNLKKVKYISLSNNPIRDISYLKNVEIVESEDIVYKDRPSIRIIGLDIDEEEIIDIFGEKSKYVYH